jgi:GNAT superfamily N-acetyltransferase
LSAGDDKPFIEKLTPSHVLTDFDCGVPALNRFLQNFALRNQAAGSSITYLAMIGRAVAGYHTLTVGEMVHNDAPDRLSKGLARHPIPVMVIARLAVDLRIRGRGLGAALLRDALLRTLAAADIAGIRAVVVNAKDDRATAFYEYFGFTPFPNDPFALYRLLKDIRARP